MLNAMKGFTSSCRDDFFGPSVQSSSCRGGFDFTVLFEESVLSILPATCFILLAPLRAVYLSKGGLKARSNSLHAIKLGTIGIFASFQVALLALWSTNLYFKTRLSAAAAALNVVVALGLALLSHLEHLMSIRPSFLITIYLFASVIFDIARVRTQWLLPENTIVAAVFTSSFAVKSLLLVLEGIQKRHILLSTYRDLSPETTSGIFDRGVFWWLVPLLLSGFKRVLSVKDLFPINDKLSSERIFQDLEARWKKCNQNRKHALMVQSLMALKWEIATIAFPRLCLVGLKVAQPFLINELVNYINAHDSIASNNFGYGLIGAYAFVYIGIAITTGWYQHLVYRLMTMMRGGLIAMIYEKMIGLKSANINDSAATTLMGTDVENIAETWHFLLTEVWANMIQLGISIWLLQRELGPASVAPVIVAIVATAMTMKATSFVTVRQKIWLEAIQERINFTSEILGSINSVKTLGLTGKMTSLIQGMRVRELELSKRFRRLSSFNVCLANLPYTITPFFTFAAFAIVSKVNGNASFSVSLAVTSLSILNLLVDPLGALIWSTPRGYAAVGCFARIQQFLMGESQVEQRILDRASGSKSPLFEESASILVGDNIELAVLPNSPRETNAKSFPSTSCFVINEGSFGWSHTSKVVKNVTMQISSNSQLTIIVGPVGCGKSTLLKGILGETMFSEGLVYVKTPEIAFCDQTAWIINGSIRNNIIGQSFFENDWYDSVVRACALDTDLELMPNGDATIVGSKGIILSGGQKQRIAIARAVYARKQLTIFDDVLSGLDAVTEQLVFSRVFGQQGLLRSLGTTAILATHAVNRLPEADHIIVLGAEGQILEQGSFRNLLKSGSYIQRLRLDPFKEQSTEDFGGQQNSSKAYISGNVPRIEVSLGGNRQSGDWRIYKYYTASLGWLSLLVFVAFLTSNSAMGTLRSVWLNWWSESNGNHANTRLGFWLGIYGLLAIIEALALILSVFYMYVFIVPRSAQNLHWAVLQAAMRAPVSFFTSTETGILVNRFSQDMRLVDMTLPGALVNASFTFGSCIGVVVLAVVAVGYFAAALPLIVGVLYLVQRFYLRTSRQLRLLDLETKAPIYSHFLESLQGIVTIRAFGWTDAYKKQNLRLIDASQKPYYLLLCVQQWLLVVLNLIVAAMAIILVGLAVALRSRLNPGFLGIALVSVMSLGPTLANLIQSWTSMETSLGAIARIKDFSENTPSELLPEEDMEPDPAWPAEGELRFEDISARYSSNSPLILNHISMVISPGQKIGICGRTGSGKSSFINSILRMLDLTSGKITIDNIDLSIISRALIRERLTCLTQQPFLFTGSVRQNADPLGAVSDEEIVTALEKVGIWTVILSKFGNVQESHTKILDVNMDENFLSHGQRQLFCLARAMLKKSSILILDEPTSSIDVETDVKMQAIIRSEFKHHTIIMIAHRLHTILDFDRVAVLDKGIMVEFGQPEELLRSVDSAFSKLCHGASHGRRADVQEHKSA